MTLVRDCDSESLKFKHLALPSQHHQDRTHLSVSYNSSTFTPTLRCVKEVRSVGLDLQGPGFLIEPPYKMEFSNSSGGRLDCTAHGSPPPNMEWIHGDGLPVTPIPELRLVYPNGSLVFLPFAADRYRHDVHTATYRCRARNQVGQVISRDVRVRAVVKQKYEVQVYDEYVISGNTAVLRCQVPSYVSEYIMVTSWVQDGIINIYPNTDTGIDVVIITDSDSSSASKCFYRLELIHEQRNTNLSDISVNPRYKETIRNTLWCDFNAQTIDKNTDIENLFLKENNLDFP
ncbi:hypothetical protein J6590_012055 [Homalodisca vitripennis]|nr:hypothetical protein J6590_012055 [Homalodisca vitripennis]